MKKFITIMIYLSMLILLIALVAQAAAVGVAVTAIGRFVAAGEGGPQARFLAGGLPLAFARTSFSHF